MNEIGDLVVAMTVMGAISLGCGWLALKWRPRGEYLVMGITLAVAGGVLFIWFAAGRLLWAHWVPSSAAIAWTNVSPILLAISCGWMWHLSDRPLWRRGLFATLLGLAALGSVLWPLLGPFLRPPPPGGDKWFEGIAMQTEWANCSPAAAATLLHAAHISATEAEMVPLCLTDSRGTPSLGLYRGLKLKTHATEYELRVIHGMTLKELAELSMPAVLLVELPQGTQDRRYEDDQGWIPGMGHSVVCFGRMTEDLWKIGDPAAGPELWTQTDLELLWTGDAIALQPGRGVDQPPTGQPTQMVSAGL